MFAVDKKNIFRRLNVLCQGAGALIISLVRTDKIRSQPPHANTAIRPVLPANDGHLRRSTSLTHHIQGGARFHGFWSMLC